MLHSPSGMLLQCSNIQAAMLAKAYQQFYNAQSPMAIALEGLGKVLATVAATYL